MARPGSDAVMRYGFVRKVDLVPLAGTAAALFLTLEMARLRDTIDNARLFAAEAAITGEGLIASNASTGGNVASTWGYWPRTGNDRADSARGNAPAFTQCKLSPAEAAALLDARELRHTPGQGLALAQIP